MKNINLIFGIYGILYPIFLLLDFEYKKEIYIGLVAAFIIFILLKRYRDLKIYKDLKVKYYLTSIGGTLGIRKSRVMIVFLIFYFGLSYIVFRQDFHHGDSASSIELLFNTGVIVYIFSRLKTSDIKIADTGIIDSDDTKLIPYSNIRIDSLNKIKFRIKISQKDSVKRFSILVDKSAEISYDDLIEYLNSKVNND